MATIGYATLQVIPSLQGIEGAISSSLGGVDAAGRKAGASLGQSMAAGIDSQKAAIAAAADKVAKARDKEADAAGKVRTAEAQLATLRDKGVTDAGRLTAAEERVEKAKRDSTTASKSAETATKNLTDAEEKLTKASDDSANAVEGVGKKSMFSAENLAKFGAVAAAGIGLAGAALYKVGTTFDDVSDTIRTGTGATGDRLDALVGVAKDVGREVPASFEQIGQAVADLSSKMHLTDSDLQVVSGQILNLQNMGQEVNLDAIAGTMNAFGVASGDTAATLDELFRVSQATGVPVSDLAAAAEKGAPALKEFGFGAASSAGIIGSLEKAGLDADKMVAGLNKGLANFAKTGKDPQQALYGTVVEIENFTKAGNDAAAIDMSAKLFGTKGAAQFVDAVKAGTFSVDDFVGATGAGTDTINNAAEDTKDFAEQWQLFKNQALLEIEPIATRVFAILGDGMKWISENGIPALKDMAHWVSENKTALTIAGVALGALVTGMIAYNTQQKIMAAGGFLKFLGSLMTGTKLAAAAQFLLNTAMWTSPITWIVAGIAGLVAVIVLIATKTDWFSTVWNTVWGGIKTGFGAVVDFIKDHWQLIVAIITGPIGIVVALVIANWDKIKAATAVLVEALAAAWTWLVGVWQGVWDAIVAAWNTVWGALKAGFDAFVAIFTQVIPGAVVAAKDWIVNTWNEVVGFVTGLPERIRNAAAGMWDGIKDAFKGALNWLIQAWNDFQISMKIPSNIPIIGGKGFTIDTPDLPLLAAGGPVPGTRNPIGFPTGDDQLIAAKTGEYVMPVGPTRANFGLLEAMRIRGYAGGGVIEPYGLASSSSPFPQWVHDLESKYGVTASTYPGHQENDRSEAGYAPNPEHLNRGIDWGADVSAMQGFADAMLAGAPSWPQLEQIIWMNPQTGQRIGWAGGNDVTNTGYFAADYPGHTDHVHTRQSGALGAAAAPKINPFENNPLGAQGADQVPGYGTTDSTSTGTTSTTGTTATTATTEPKSYPTTISGFAGLFGKAFAEGQAQSLLGVLGVPDSAPGLDAYNKLRTQQDASAAKAKEKEKSTSTGTTDAGFGAVPTEPKAAPIPAPTPGSGLVSTGNAVKDTVRGIFANYGWGTGQAWDDTDWIVDHESSWNPTAVNPSSGAFGLFQFLGSTADQYLPDRNSDPGVQGEAGRRYINDRYGTPMDARAFWESHNWYDQGGVANGTGLLGKNILDPERVLSNRQTTAFEQMVDRDFTRNGGGEHVVYNISTARVEDAFVAAQNQQKRRALAKVGSF